jgi:hypothetical protein
MTQEHDDPEKRRSDPDPSFPQPKRPLQKKRAWEEYYETYPDQIVTDRLRRWERNRVLFDESDGLRVDRDFQLELRAATERAREQLNDADDQWVNAHYPQRGRISRRWDKRRMDFFKAVCAENDEYEQTLRHHGFDPEDDAAIDALRRDISSEDDAIEEER